MTVDITQDEMNILNLNGISAEDVRANVEFSRATGMDDDAIRQQFSNTIEKLKPITKVSANDTGKIKEWQDKGAMSAFEVAHRTSREFNGYYDNIDNSANLSPLGQKLENSAYNDKVEQRIQAAKNQKAERNKRVNEGTGSFFDRAGAALDRMGQASYQAQLESADLNKKRQGIDETDDTKKHNIIGLDRAGQPIYKEIDLSQKIGFQEAMAETFPKGLALGAVVDAFDNKKEREIEEKIRTGKPIRQDELDYINRRIDFRNEKRVRGYSYGGHVGSTLGYALGIGFDLLAGTALFRAAGLGAVGTTIGNSVTNIAKGNKVAQVGGKAVEWSANRLAETGLTTIINSPYRLFQGYQERMLNNEMKLTDRGSVIFQESDEKPAMALYKSLQGLFVEYFTEIAGGELLRFAAKPIVKAGGKIAKNVESSLMKNLFAKYPKLETVLKNSASVFAKKYEEINNLKVVGSSREWIKNNIHFDGFLEEMGEEALADVLNLTLGTHNEERSLENYAKAIFKSPDEWAVLAGAIAIQGAGLSMVGASIANNMAKNGASIEEIQTVIENLTENQLQEIQSNYIAQGEINIEETEEQHFEKTVSSVAESLLQSGKFKNKETADKAVRLGATMLESMSKKTGKSLDELIQEDMAEIEEIDESAYADENGRLYASIDNSPMTIESRINNLLDEVNKLSDETDSKIFDKIISEISLLENLQSGNITIDNIELANDLISDYEAEGNTEVANLLRTALEDVNAGNSAVYFQKVDNSNIENEFGETVENLTNIISEDVKNILTDNFIEEKDFKFEDIRLYGSYTKGKNKETSDLDVLVQYSGTMKEDGAFNMFADAELSITDKNGRIVKIDINPINVADSGTIDEHIERMESLEKANKTQAYYQKRGQGLKDAFKNAIINIIEKIESADENIFTVSDMLPHIPMFDSIQDFFADIHDVKIELVSDSEYKNGRYIPELDSVKINKDSLKNSKMPIGRIETLLHELQHAKQKRIYEKYQALLENKSQLSAEQIAEYETYCTNYESTGKANREKDEFYRKHKRELDKIKRLRSRLNNYEFELELLRYEKLLEIDNQRRKIYDKYINSFGEVDARETAKQLIYRMGYGDIYENQNRQFIQLQLHSRAERARGRGIFSRRGSVSNGGFGISGSSETQRGTPRYFQEDKDAQETGNDSRAGNRGNQTSTKQRKIFIDNDKADIILNRLEKVKGTFIPAENLIALFRDSDESTIIHEFAHWWLDKLVKYAAENEEIQDDLNEIRKFVRNNGEPFTTDQHERFARGFEAYMRTGSARTNRLKKLFEDFKNAILSLYDSIKELGFEEDEIPQINNLFERLLTTENQRIQAAVFDKCNSINAQIQEIRENQEKEFAEIEEIERNNLERNLRDNKKTQQIKEYLRLAQKAASRVPKGVKEYQERYKNATFQILEVATGYKRQFIANPKNWEIIEQKIADLDDQITTQDGMQANWREFYADTGVSYGNDDIDGDYKLAEQAFRTLTSGNYSPKNMEEEEIGRFFGMFDYLEGKVMTLKGENKSAAYEALCSLFNDIPTMPDEAMLELVDKLKSVGEKFLDQKSMEKNPVLGISNVSLSVQFRTYVTSKLHNMKAYDPESKRTIRLSQVNRLYTLLKFSNSVAETKQIIRTINNHAIEQLENRQKFILHKEIQKQVRINSKLIKVGALKRGKFDWKTNTVFSELQDLNRLSLEAAQKEYQRLINADSAVLGEERESIKQNPATSLSAPTEFQAILKTKFLEYKANRVRDLNLAATRSLLEDIMELKFEGRRAKNKEELKKALSRYDYETDLVRVAYLNKNDKFANYLTRWTAGDTIFTSEGTLANWESLLNHIFDKNTAQKYSLLKTEADVEVYAHRKCLEFYRKALDIYGLRNKDSSSKGRLKDLYDRALDFDNTQPIIKLFQEYEDAGHTYTFKQNTYNKDTNDFVETSIELTHSQLITLYAWSLNPELKKRIIVQFVGEPEDNNYTEYEGILNDIMFSKLSNQDKEFAQAMIDICDSMYNDTNEVFIRTTGLSLPRVENYIPSKTERIGSDLDMLHENVLRSTNPSFIKQRKTCRRIKMEPVSPLEIILPHINKTSRYIIMSEKVNFYNRIFQSPDVKAAILDIYGKKSGTKIYRVLLNQLATSTYENYARAITVGKNLMDTIASNYITSRIGGNIKVFLSQLTSVINYAENMPAMDWTKGFKEALAHPKETVDFMFNNCEYLQARLAGNSQNEIIATLTNEADKMRSWRNFCTANTKYGDILAIIFGGKPYVDYLMSQGMSKETAFERFVESTLRSQQSGHNSATSAWQKEKAQDALTRMIYAFNNTNFQYERKFIDALSNYHRKHITREEFAKAFLVYKIFNPILFSSFLTNLSILILLQNMFGGGDDEPFKTFGLDAISSIALSNWKAYGLLGIIANSLVSAACISVSGDKFFESKLPLISDFEMSIQKLIKGNKLETSDYIEMIAGAADYTTGVAATRIYNSLGGVGDIAQGEFGKGFLRILGYGNYRAEVAATGQEPKKYKK